MTADNAPALPHLTDTGAAHMVDVSTKQQSAREAVAAGRLLIAPSVVAVLRGGAVPKGDALAVARLAGIMAAKRVPELIPLAHVVALSGVVVDLEITDASVEITVTARTTDRTGVEMEALTGVAVAGLALHDMVKALDPAAVLSDVRLLRKSGGRHGDWVREP